MKLSGCVFVCVLAFGAACITWGCSGSTTTPGTVGAVQALKGDNANGATVWKNNCVGCHGTEGKGIPDVGEDLTTSAAKERADAELIATILNGKGKMPAYKATLSDQQVADVLAYVRKDIQKK